MSGTMESTTAMKEKLERWAERLKGLTNISPLTRDYPETGRQPIEAYEFLQASVATREAIRTLQDATGVPAFLALLTAYVVVVSRLTGDEDIVIGTNADQDARTFVLRVPTASSDAFDQLQSKVVTTFNAFSEDLAPLESIRSQLEALGEPKLLFRFAAHNAPTASRQFVSGQKSESIDITLNISCSTSGEIELGAFYNQRLFSSSRIATILSQILRVAEGASVDTSEAIGRIGMLTESQTTVLPDPKCDLEWSNFRGAIQDIFSSNAIAHPDRLCVVETGPVGSESQRREFTYKQIDEASNILGHHLVGSGVERGDVVMAYAHRGVDLVVAVMGILKAGATFSVIDPQYPPDRQNIYLEVAQPRALVVIEKATKEAGGLSEKVTAFIEDNLNLRTTISALALQDDGALMGGAVNGKDIFADIVPLKSSNPGVIVGPDSTPTLSFTSGSEGRPKGVRGRHFSLAYYFPWMSKTFKLSQDDRFTMLSGIAHDPIQRDIFTPLFLGAQLLVPSREDIQNEKLAEWMKAYGATVTHLTPAMGQILVGEAKAIFPALHHAFFVGDILIKRDCRALQSLAPNVNIVNMYGTTETQRAVSFYEIPSISKQEGFLDSMKDIIPAGRGMHNVQLLVVNRFDRSRLCAVGEIGEIYVRAAGLAEGYLGTRELSEKKFVSNWFTDPGKWGRDDAINASKIGVQEPWKEFYLGPRDRLYRSGDLGRYTPDGAVECSGRADDQVKIRGFRIELGEIDTHLSQHPLVRENVTLVRRDKDEEQTLVSYVVPDMKEWYAWLKSRSLEDDNSDESMIGNMRRFRPLSDDARTHLRSKLPAYAVPSVFVPMVRLPLNPNGKVDKPKLPFPDSATLSAGKRRKSSILTKLTETEHALAQIWADVLPNVMARTIQPDATFEYLGGHSLSVQSMIRRVNTRWPEAKIGLGSAFSNLHDLASEIDHAGESFEHDTTSQQANGVAKGGSGSPSAYTADAEAVTKLLPTSFPEVSTTLEPSHAGDLAVFLTGVTGFLGAYILRDLMHRKVNVIALVRAPDSAHALDRVRNTCKAYGVWSESWRSLLQCLNGDLAAPQFGLDQEKWEFVAKRADVVIHNGAQVHWIYPYSRLKASNVLGTLETLRLCASGKGKRFAFVSSTSVLDNDFYVRESERSIVAGGKGISEADNLQGSSNDLTVGYGQSKWVAEKLVREAGERGLTGCIIRPGYVTGDSKTGITNTDDFLVRMIKGCIQLSSRPNINNTINMVPVDHVARVVVAGALNLTSGQRVHVANVTSHPRLRFNQFLEILETYGYQVPVVDYNKWTGSLDRYVSQTNGEAQHAL